MQFLENRYAKLALLTIGIAVLIYAVLWIIFMLIGLSDFPQSLLVVIAIFGAGLLVYRFMAQKIF